MPRLTRRELLEADVSQEIEGRYARQALELLAEYEVRVCRWNRRMTGAAFLRVPGRPIIAPHPRSPLSFAILAHEVGHHALARVRPRCLEEYRAWQFAFEQLDRFGIDPGQRTQDRYRRSMQWALHKALRRGLRTIPVELRDFMPPTARTRS